MTVLVTGETYTVKDFLQEAFNVVSLDWNEYVESSQKYFRPNEVDFLLGDSTKELRNLDGNQKLFSKI